MIDSSSIQPHMPVVGSDKEEVGTVDHLDGTDTIKLSKSDSADGKHHWIPLEWVDTVEDDSVVLTLSAERARQDWRTESPQ